MQPVPDCPEHHIKDELIHTKFLRKRFQVYKFKEKLNFRTTQSKEQGCNKNINWGGGVFIHIFMFCPTDFFGI